MTFTAVWLQLVAWPSLGFFHVTFVTKFLFNCKVPMGKLIAAPPDLHDGCKFYKQKRVGSVSSKTRATAMGLRIQVKEHYLHFF